MKKIALILCGLMAVLMLASCGNTAQDSQTKGTEGAGEEKKLSIVTTIFPEYDWVKQIIGDDNDGTELTMLLDDGVDLHSYQPTPDDVIKISSCDLFIYVGGESDAWVEDALKKSTNKDMKAINLMDVIGEAAKEEEVVEGMEAEEEESPEDGEEAGGEEGPEYDEHVWLSLKNAQTLVSYIADMLSEVDAEHAASYKENAKAYVDELKELDGEYQAAVDDAEYKTVLFGDRFPFRYMTDDYGLSYYAAFVGCSAETEASFETVTFLAGKVDELHLPAVLTIEGSDHKIAKTIVENTADKSAQILTLDSMQATTSSDVENGASYLGIMKENLKTLKKALK